MNEQIAAFIAAHYHRHPTGRVKLRDALDKFLESLPTQAERRGWPRWRFVAEVSREFPVGSDGCGRAWIGGISDTPPQRWAVDDAGRLRLTCA